MKKQELYGHLNSLELIYFLFLSTWSAAIPDFHQDVHNEIFSH